MTSTVQEFLVQLSQRRVVRVAAFYAGGALVLLEATQLLSEVLQLPGWIFRWVGIALLSGFPIVLVLSWVFDITPDGIQRSDGPTLGQPIGAASRIVLTIGATFALVAMVWVGWRLAEPIASGTPDARVPNAVTKTGAAEQDTPADDLTTPATEPPLIVAVVPVSANSEHDQEFAQGLSYSMTRMLADSYGGISQQNVWIIPTTDLIRMKVETSIDAYKMFKATRVISAQILRVVDGSYLNVEIIDPTSTAPRVLTAWQLSNLDENDFEQTLYDSLHEQFGYGQPLFDLSGGQSQFFRYSGSHDVHYNYTVGQGLLRTSVSEDELDAAIEIFQQSLMTDPDYAPSYAGICEARWRKIGMSGNRNQVDLADYACGRASVASDTTRVSLASALIDAKALDAAWKALQPAVRNGYLPSLPLPPSIAEFRAHESDAYRLWGRLMALQGNFEGALAAYQIAITANPAISLAHYDFAKFLFCSGEHEKSVSAFWDAIRYAPENLLYQHGLKRAYLTLGMNDEAEDISNEILSQMETSTDAYDVEESCESLGL